ncbi:MAG: hypothetical protein ACI91O_000385 [Candidatus Poriferisodalaceae bacterium]
MGLGSEGPTSDLIGTRWSPFKHAIGTLSVGQASQRVPHGAGVGARRGRRLAENLLGETARSELQSPSDQTVATLVRALRPVGNRCPTTNIAAHDAKAAFKPSSPSLTML